MTKLADKFEQALLSFDKLAAKEIINSNIEENPFKLIEKIVIPALENIGRDWSNGNVALSQVYMSGRICEQLVDDFLPPASPSRIKQPKMAIATLEDYHSLGKMIIYSALRASGFSLDDWGRLNAEELINKATISNCRIILISVLMLPSALQVKTVTEQLKTRNPAIKILVGGAPFRFDNQLWKEVGADAMGQNTLEAIDLAHQMTSELS